MIVGEAPGKTEDEGGQPFIGASGRLFFRLLAEETGIERDECFVTNVVKCRPPANRTPSTTEIETCRPWLDEQLSSVSPRVVVTLGLVAARAVFGIAEPMGQAHGKVRQLGPVPGLATYHPAAALRRGPTLVEVLREDLRVVKGLVA